jgi:perosamine synthetase
MKFLLNTPLISNLEKKYVNDVLKSSWLSINGKHTKIFENKFKKFIGRKHCIAVQSGTAAIHLATKALNIKFGEKIIVPNYTCVSNISATKQSGLIPILVDIEEDTLGLDFKKVKIAVEKYKPKALHLIHIYGFPARDTKKIVNFCKKNKIKIIEDCSESLGAKIEKKKIGNFGDISIFSVRSEKMIGVGEVGIILTNNKKLFKKIYFYASRSAPFRSKKDPYWKKYYSKGEGYNYLMPHLLGAVGRAQIEKFEKSILKKKIEIGMKYRAIFKSKYYDFTQKIIKSNYPVFWLNSIKFKSLSFAKICKIGENLSKQGIEVRSGFWPLSKLPGFNSIKADNMKNSTNIFNKILVLPSNINLSTDHLTTIFVALNKIIEKNK